MEGEGRFPGNRDPLSLDSRYASAPLDPALLRAFKKSLPLSGRPSHFVSTTRRDLVDPRHRNGFAGSNTAIQRHTSNNGQYPSQRAAEDSRQQKDSQNQDLLYPVAMFSDFPELPSAEVLSKLLDIFTSRFLPCAPFIAGLHMGSTSEFQRDKTPPFLTFAMAVVGALVSDDRDLILWGPNLWQAASHVHSAACEVDNRVARKVDWVTSFIFLEIYGIMHADAELWSKTNIWNGHVDTGAKRMGLNNLHYGVGADKTNTLKGPKITERSKIMGLYFLIDLLRSLQLGVPASFQSFDLSIPLSQGLSFRQLYEDVIIKSKSVPAALQSDDYFLLLLAILSEILALQRVIGPLFDFSIFDTSSEGMDDLTNRPKNHYQGPSVTSNKSLPQSKEVTGAEEISSNWGTRLSLYNNPFLTLSASAEYTRISTLLNHALDEWAAMCLSYVEDRYIPKAPENPRSQVPVSVVPLFHFCRMLLSGGPRLLSIIWVAGYCPEKGFKAPMTISADQIPNISDETLAHAWHILEAVEDQKASFSSSSGREDNPKALWSPIVVFYAGLTVWASLQAPVTNLDGRGGLRIKKFLRLFEMELRDMKWPCTPVMADILQELRNR